VQPHILDIDEESEIQNDSFFLYDGMLDIYINKGLGEKNHHNYHKHKDDSISIPSDFNISEYSHEITAKILVYIYSSGVEKITRLPNIFSNIFGGENTDKISHSFGELYQLLHIQNIQDILPHMRLFRDNNIQDTSILNALHKFGDAIHESHISAMKDNRIALNLSSYQECIKNETGIFDLSFPVEQSAGYIESLHTPKMLNEFKKQVSFSYGENIHLFGHIDEDLGVDITQLLFSNQIQLFNFLWSKKPEEFNHFKQILSQQKNKLGFLTTFLACSKTAEIGEKIIQLAQHKDSEKIFSAYAQIVDLQSQFQDHDISQIDFLKTILKKGEKLLLEAEDNLQKEGSFDIGKKYSDKLIKSGAFVKALLRNQQKGTLLEMDEFNQLSQDLHFSSFRGGDILSDLGRKYTQLDMLDESTYKDTLIFGPKHYTMLCEAIRENYRNTLPEDAELIINELPESLQNPENTFYTMMDKISSDPISMNRMSDDGYFGLQYSHKDYIGDFGIGGYMFQYAMQKKLQDFQNTNQTITLTAVANNPAISLQVNQAGFIIDGSFIETYPNGKTGNILEMSYEKNTEKFQTKNIKKFPPEKIRDMYNNPENNKFHIIKSDISDISDGSEYTSTVSSLLQQGYVGTRFIPDPDHTNITYLIFETKNQEL
ncbi:MAG: hypothetical protein GY828_01390, partial [Candidatus Gracilibacteria bacterium]|nr:hypothetical protein [Candidatus Gracilibacteria bacterium]